jgi:hypothetical protein
LGGASAECVVCDRDAQIEQIEQSLPTTKVLINLLNKAHPIIEQARWT